MAVLCLSPTAEGEGEEGEGERERVGEWGERRVGGNEREGGEVEIVREKRERSPAARGSNLNLNSSLAKTFQPNETLL